MPTRLLIVANRLPLTVAGDAVKKSSGGLVAALGGVSAEAYDVRWVGWPGGDTPADRQPAVADMLDRDAAATAVFLSPGEVAGYYHGFSNASLWPLLHDMPSRFAFEASWWDTYRAVNRRFADATLAALGDGADPVVWVHDYQLMLVPALLREARPELRVGFFLHTPFPPYETFRYLPRRAEVVAGLLGADLIGFHTFGYLRHYRDCLLRLLGVDTDMTRVRADDRTRTLAAYPIGINAVKAEAELATDRFGAERAKLAHAHAGHRLVVSVERLDYTKGILRRLDAIDHYLDRHADEGKTVKFVFVSVPSREEVDEYRQLKADVEAAVGRINGRHATASHSPIHFIYGSVDFTELMALYNLADVGLVTPLVDGMNLVAKEYVAAQTVAGDAEPGVLVLSEFAGAAEELFNATIVNPYDADAVAAAIHAALNVPADERRRRMGPMRERVMAFDAARWAAAFVADLRSVDPHADQPTGDPDAAQKRLADAVGSGKRVALFLDYDGTLREIVADPAAAAPTDAILDLLRRLIDLPNVDVTIISGRRAVDLDRFVGSFPFALVAEHGADYRPAGGPWRPMDMDVNYGWKDQIRPVLDQFQGSTPGSFVEDKRTSLVWHYRRADPEFGSWKANQLAAELAAVSANEPVTIRHGKKIVEATAAEVNKGAAVDRLIQGKGYDLVVCAGDDTTDETMFRLRLDDLLGVRVGRGETRAHVRLRDPAAFRAWLSGALPR